MKNHYVPFLCALLSAVLVLSGDALGGTPTANVKAAKAKKCLFPKSKKRAPNWVCDSKVDGWAVTAVGSAIKSKAGISFMEQMAAADARMKLARSLSEAAQKNIAGKANAANKDMKDRGSALITDSDESMQGAKIIKRAYGPKGTLYVLVGLDETSAKKQNESIPADYHQQKRK